MKNRLQLHFERGQVLRVEGFLPGMWALYKAAVAGLADGAAEESAAASPFLRQCFVTANPVLLDTVRSSFVRSHQPRIFNTMNS